MGVMFRDSLVVADVVIADAIADSTEIDFGDFSSGAVHGFTVKEMDSPAATTNKILLNFHGAFESGGTYVQIYEEAAAADASDAVKVSVQFDMPAYVDNDAADDIDVSVPFPDSCFAFPFVKVVWELSNSAGTDATTQVDDTVTISLKS